MYVLIAIFMSANSTVATLNQEFTDQTKCLAAKAAIMASPSANYAFVDCKPK